jgi:hypothetical protein
MKSNALLMIYNLVESTVINGLNELYNKLNSNNVTYSAVRKEIQDLWFTHKFRQSFKIDDNYKNYMNKAREIINLAVSENSIQLNEAKFSFKGNLDEDKILAICKEHGITFNFSIPPDSAERLKVVKRHRNDLSHGESSFAECGGSIVFVELTKIKEQAYSFLSEFLNCVKDYYDNDRFLK